MDEVVGTYYVRPEFTADVGFHTVQYIQFREFVIVEEVYEYNIYSYIAME